jgi:hypothetical protein
LKLSLPVGNIAADKNKHAKRIWRNEAMRIADTRLLRGACSARSNTRLRALPVLLVAILGGFAASSSLAGKLTLDSDDIGGTVRSAQGPEAGVWVIAETADLASPMARTVVTDEEGRYLIPDLPKAKYKLWVRGYGLVDSKPVEARPGTEVDLKAVVAPDARDAAQYYPANYWYSLLRPPPPSAFPGTGPQGNGIPPAMKTQQHWLASMKENCLLCHQLGTKTTREIRNREKFGSSVEAWQDRMVQAGIGSMMANLSLIGLPGLEMFADWSDRIAAGDVPSAPPRPSGIERNVVITAWDWAVAPDGRPQFVHDEIATDKRNPNINANGRVYGVAQFAGKQVWIDPNTHTTGEAILPSNTTKSNQAMGNPATHVAPDSSQPHNPMMGPDGRVWNTTINRDASDQPGWCTDTAKNEFAKAFPMPTPIGRAAQLSVFDPDTGITTHVDTCFGTHHLEFGFDEDNTLYLSGDVNVMGWVNTRIFDETGDAQAASGWCPTTVDTNGDGKIGEAVGHTDPVDPSKDKHFMGFLYGLGVNPVDDSVWYAHFTDGTNPVNVPGGIFRMDKGDDPPETCKVERYAPPASEKMASAFNPRGVDLDTQGIAWVAFGSGHLGRFDRSKCSVLNGPTATGQHCPEGWTLYKTPSPQLKGVESHGSSDWHYLIWVDQHNVLGLGKDVPVLPGTLSDSLIAFVPEKEEFVVMRVPYPLGFFPRGLDGRIDDPELGWKGRGLWSNYASWPVSHREGANGERVPGKVVKVQLRPNPLAR